MIPLRPCSIFLWTEKNAALPQSGLLFHDAKLCRLDISQLLAGDDVWRPASASAHHPRNAVGRAWQPGCNHALIPRHSVAFQLGLLFAEGSIVPDRVETGRH